MKKLIRSAAAVCLTCLLSLLAAGCAGSLDADRQVARIGESIITQQALDTYTALSMYREGYDPSEVDVGQTQQCLEEMVNAEAVCEYYRNNGTEIYDDAYNSGKNAFLGEIQSNEAEFLDQNDISYDDLIRFYRNQFVIGKFFEETRAQYEEDTVAAEAQAYYESHLEDYKVDKEKRLSLILTKKKKQAAGAVQRLDQGEDFATVAREVSVDSNSAASGGDLGFFNKQEVRSRFGKGIFVKAVGEYTEEPVKTGDGYAVILITDSHDSGYQPYDEVARDIIYSLYENYNNQRLDDIKSGLSIELAS